MMSTPYHHRILEAALTRRASQFPAVVVTGPRQTGKTTLVREVFGTTHAYVTLDDPRQRDLALEDPRLFLARNPPPVVLDEVQYAPEVLSSVKVDIDAHRHHYGRFVLTGSQLFPLMHGVSESLAGRAAPLVLHGMSLGEATGDCDRDPAQAVLAQLATRSAPEALRSSMDVASRLVSGGFPEPALREDLDVPAWHAAYVRTYLERDVRSLRAVGQLRDFQRFVVATAARSAGLYNAAEVARDVGISPNTATAWLSVLEASGQVAVLAPFYRNLGRRLAKAPKVYFTDSGMLAHLLRVRTAEDLVDGPMGGPIFESAVLGALLRLFTHRGEEPPLYTWRTRDGHEVDFVVDLGARLVPVEAKLTATPTPRHARAIRRFQALFGDAAPSGFVVCLVDEPALLAPGVWAVPIGALG